MPRTSTTFVCKQTRGFDPIPGVQLPSVDEASLVALATKLAVTLAPGYTAGSGTAVLRSCEVEDVGMGEYTTTSERQHGGEHGVRFLQVEESSSDGAGPSVSAIHRTVSVPGFSAETQLDISVHIRPVPFGDAGLRVEATLACPSDERLARAVSILEATFVAGQVAR